MTYESFKTLQYNIEDLINNNISFWSRFESVSYMFHSITCKTNDDLLDITFNDGKIYIRWIYSTSIYIFNPKNFVEAINYIIEFIFNRHQENIKYMNVSISKVCNRIDEYIKYKIGVYKMYSRCYMMGASIRVISEHNNVPDISILYNKSNISVSNYRDGASWYLLLNEKDTILEIENYITATFKYYHIDIEG